MARPRDYDIPPNDRNWILRLNRVDKLTATDIVTVYFREKGKKLSVEFVQRVIREESSVLCERLVLGNPGMAVCDPRLEEKLHKQLALNDLWLRRLWVVRTQDRLKALEREKIGRHDLVGGVAGRCVLSYLRKGDCLGVSGGRFARALAESFTSRAEWTQLDPLLKDTLVYQLTGHVKTHPDSNRDDPQRAYLSADEVARKLSGALGSKLKLLLDAQTRQVLPLVSKKRPDRRVLKEAIESVHVAIVGVGVFHDTHRLQGDHTDNSANRLKVNDPKRGGVLEDMINASRKVEGMVREEYGSDYYSLGDCLNRFFVIPPPGQGKSLKQEVDKLNRCVKAFNNCIVAMTFKELKSIANRGAVFAVTGGGEKGPAVLEMLRMSCITHLVTDDELAEWFLANPMLRQGNGSGRT